MTTITLIGRLNRHSEPATTKQAELDLVTGWAQEDMLALFAQGAESFTVKMAIAGTGVTAEIFDQEDRHILFTYKTSETEVVPVLHAETCHALVRRLDRNVLLVNAVQEIIRGYFDAVETIERHWKNV